MATSIDQTEVKPPDFSQHWLFSDVVLVVQRRKFHVHRVILTIWSPVFKKMFTSEFREKYSFEIPLPGKEASEIEELLQLIYSNVSGRAWNSITNENCYFLTKLAHEYQMEVIFKRCEDFLIEKVSNMSGNGFLTDLVFAQTYDFETLLKITVEKASKLRLDDFKGHEMYDHIEPHIYKQIAEKMIQRHEARGCRY